MSDFGVSSRRCGAACLPKRGPVGFRLGVNAVPRSCDLLEAVAPAGFPDSLTQQNEQFRGNCENYRDYDISTVVALISVAKKLYVRVASSLLFYS